MNEDIPVIILAGGKGTRLREETEFKPKPMVEIQGKPILHHIMDIYRKHGIRTFIVALGYKGDMIRDYFLNYQNYTSDLEIDMIDNNVTLLDENKEDFKVILVDTGEDTLTAKRIKLCEKYVYSDRFMVTYGDGVADIDITKLLEFHKGHPYLGTVTGVRPPSRFGELDIVGNTVNSFSEKPNITEGYINGGFFVFDKGFFSFLTDENQMLEKEPLTNLAKYGQLMVYKHNGFWKCMDTYKDYKDLNNIYAMDKNKW